MEKIIFKIYQHFWKPSEQKRGWRHYMFLALIFIVIIFSSIFFPMRISGDALFETFSVIVQSLVTLVPFAGMMLIYKFQKNNDKGKNNDSWHSFLEFAVFSFGLAILCLIFIVLTGVLPLVLTGALRKILSTLAVLVVIFLFIYCLKLAGSITSKCLFK